MATVGSYSIEILARTEDLTAGIDDAQKKILKFYDRVEKRNKESIKELTETQEKYHKKLSEQWDQSSDDFLNAIKDQTKDLEKQLREQLANVKKSEEEAFKSKKKYLEEIQKLQEKAFQEEQKRNREREQAGQRRRPPGGGGAPTGDLSRGASEAGKETAKLGGTIGKLTARLGPYGVAIGAAAGATVGVAIAAKEAAEAYDKYQAELNKLQSITGLSAKETKILGDRLREIAKPAGMAVEEVVALGSKIAVFEKDSKKIESLTGSVIKLGQAFPGADPEEVTASVGRLTAQLGDSEKAMDALASTAQLLKGKSADPLGDAMTEIGTVFSKATVSIKDTDQALKASQQVFNAFVNTGMEISEATSTAEALFEELGAAASDTDAMIKVNEVLQSTGKTIADVGLEAGNLDPEKLFLFMESAGEAGEELKEALGDSATERINLLTSALDKSGKSIKDFAVDSSGAVGGIEDLRTGMQKASDEIASSWQNLLINLGESTHGAVTEVYEAFAWALGGVADLFQPFGTQLTNAQASLEEYADATELTANSSERLQNQLSQGLEVDPGNAEQVLNDINKQIQNANGIAPEMKMLMSDIMNTDAPLNEKLSRANELLGQMNSLAQDSALSESLNAQAAAAGVLNESLESQMGTWEWLGRGAAEVLDMLTGGIGSVIEMINYIPGVEIPEPDFTTVFDFIDTIDEEVSTMFSELPSELEESKQKITELAEQAKALPQGSKEQLEVLKEMGSERGKLAELQARAVEQEQAVKDQVSTTLDVIKASNGDLSDKEAIYNQIIAATLTENEELAQNADYQEAIRQQIDAQLAGAVELANVEEEKRASVQDLSVLMDDLKSKDDETRQSAEETLLAYKNQVEAKDEIATAALKESGAAEELIRLEEERVEALQKSGAISENELKIELEKIEGLKEQLGLLEVKNALEGQSVDVAQIMLEKELEKLDTQIDQLEATKTQIKADKTRIEQVIKGLQAQGESQDKLNALTAEAANLAGTYAANISGGAFAGEQAARSTSSIVDSLKSALETADQAVANIDQEIGKLRAQRGRTQARGGGQGEFELSQLDSVIKKQSEEIRKGQEEAEKERAKNEKEAQKEIQRIEKEKLKAQKEKEKREKKAEADRIKKEKQLAKMEEDRRKEEAKERQLMLKAEAEARNEENKKRKAQEKFEEELLKKQIDAQKELAETLGSFRDGMDNIVAELKENITAGIDAIEVNTAGEGIQTQINFDQREITNVITQAFLEANEGLSGISQDIERRMGEQRALQRSAMDDTIEALEGLESIIGNEAEAFDQAGVNVLSGVDDLKEAIQAIRGMNVTQFEEATRIQDEANVNETAILLNTAAESLRVASLAAMRSTDIGEEVTPAAIAALDGFQAIFNQVRDQNSTINDSIVALGRLSEENQRAQNTVDIQLTGTESLVQDATKLASVFEEARQVQERLTEMREAATTGEEMEAYNKALEIEKSRAVIIQNNNNLGAEQLAELKDRVAVELASENITAAQAQKVNELVDAYTKVTGEIASGTESLGEFFEVSQKELNLEATLSVEATKEKINEEIEKLQKEFGTIDLISISEGQTEEIEKSNEALEKQRRKIVTIKALREELGTLTKENASDYEALSDAIKINENSLSVMTDKHKELLASQKTTESEQARILAEIQSLQQIELDLAQKILSEKEKQLEVDLKAYQQGELSLSQFEATANAYETAKANAEDLAKEQQIIRDNLQNSEDSEIKIPVEFNLDDDEKVKAAAGELQKELGKMFSIFEDYRINTKEIDLAGAKITAINDEIKRLRDSEDGGSEKEIKKLQKERSALEDSKKELEGATTSAVAKGIQGVNAIVAQTMDLTEDTIGSIGKMSDMIKGGDAGAAITEGSELTQKIGQALLSAPLPPLQVAGAVMLAVGTIGKAIGKIVSALKGRDLTQKEIAEERKRGEELIGKEYESQLAYMDQLAEAGHELYDSAAERLEILKKETAELRVQSSERGKAARLSDEQLAKELKGANDQKNANEALIGTLKLSLEQGRDVRESLLEGQGIEVKGLTNTTSEVEDLITSLEAENIDLTTDIDIFGDETSARANLKQFEEETKSALSEITQVKLDLALDENQWNNAVMFSRMKFNEIQADLKNAIGAVSNDPNEIMQRLGNMTAEQLSKLSDGTKTLIEEFRKGLTETRKVFDDMVAFDSLEDSLFSSNLKVRLSEIELLYSEEIKYMREAGATEEEITARQFEMDKEILKIKEEDLRAESEQLKDNMKMIDEEIKRAKTLPAQEEYIMDLQRQKNDLQTEYNSMQIQANDLLAQQSAEMENQNEEMSEAEKRLGKMVAKRQKLLMEMRQGSASGADVIKQTKVIEKELKAQGMDQEEINAFMATLPQFETGGLTSEGPAYLHDNEFVINESAVERYGIEFMESLNNLQIPPPIESSPVARQLTGAIMNQNQNSNVVINVSVNNDFDINQTGDQRQTVDLMLSQQTGALQKAIEQLIQQRRINFNNGGRQ